MTDMSPQVRIALKPLLETVVGLDGDARREWLESLRFECPTVSRALEGLMRETTHMPSAGSRRLDVR